jgi:hypothetical protein
MKQQEAINAVLYAKNLKPIRAEPTSQPDWWKVYVEELWVGIKSTGASGIDTLENRLAKVGARLHMTGEGLDGSWVVIGDS